METTVCPVEERDRYAFDHRGTVAVTDHKATQPERDASMFQHIIRGAIGAVLAALAGLAAVLVVGSQAWIAVRGLNGVAIAAIAGALMGGVLRGLGDWPTRALGGAVGGAFCGFFAVAAAEGSQPGSAEWLVNGGLIGAGFGLPVAAVVATISGFLIFGLRRKT
jgi:hypothetical protein